MRCIIMTFKFEFLSWPDPQLKTQRPQAQALAFKLAAEPELIKLPIPRVGSRQFLMGAGSSKPAVFQQQNLICLGNRRELVRNDESRLPLHPLLSLITRTAALRSIAQAAFASTP